MKTKIVKKDHYENGAKVQLVDDISKTEGFKIYTGIEKLAYSGREVEIFRKYTEMDGHLTDHYDMKEGVMFITPDMILGEVVEVPRIESFAVSGSFTQMSAFLEYAQTINPKLKDSGVNKFKELNYYKWKKLKISNDGTYSLYGGDSEYSLPQQAQEAYQHAKDLMDQIKEDEAEKFPKYYKCDGMVYKSDYLYNTIERDGEQREFNFRENILDGDFTEISKAEYDQAVKEMNDKKAQDNYIKMAQEILDMAVIEKRNLKNRHFLGSDYTKQNGIVKDSNGNVVDIQNVLNFTKWMLK